MALLRLRLRARPATGSGASCAVPIVSSVLIQFPFLGSIAAILTTATNADGISLSDNIAHGLATYTTVSTYPIVVSLYSTVLGTFVPSGGAHWVVAAPHVMQAAMTSR